MTLDMLLVNLAAILMVGIFSCVIIEKLDK